MALRDLPRIIIAEQDLSVFRPATVEGTRALFIGAAPKGPINVPVLCTDVIGLISSFGYPTTKGLFQAFTYLQKTGNPIYYVRTVNSEMSPNKQPYVMQAFYPSIEALGSHSDPTDQNHPTQDLATLFGLHNDYPHDLPMYMEVKEPANSGITGWQYFYDTTNNVNIWEMWPGYGIYKNSSHPTDYILGRWGSGTDATRAKDNTTANDAGSTHFLIAGIEVDTSHPDAWLYTNSEIQAFVIFNEPHVFSASEKFDDPKAIDFENDATIQNYNFYHRSWDITDWKPEILIVATENNDARDELEALIDSIKKGFRVFVNAGDASGYKNAVKNLKNKISRFGMTKYWSISDNLEARVFFDLRLSDVTNSSALQFSFELVVAKGKTLGIPSDCPISFNLKGDESNVIFATGLLLSNADTITINKLNPEDPNWVNSLSSEYPDRVFIQKAGIRYFENGVWKRPSTTLFNDGANTLSDESAWTPSGFFTHITSAGALTNASSLPNLFEIITLLFPDISTVNSVNSFTLGFRILGTPPNPDVDYHWNINYSGKLLANYQMILNWPTPTYRLLYLDEGLTTRYWGPDVKPFSFTDARIMYINSVFDDNITNYFDSSDENLRVLANFTYSDPGQGFSQDSYYLQYINLDNYKQSSVALYPELDNIFDPYESDILSPAIVDFYLLLIPGVADAQVYQRILTAIDERKDFMYIPELDETLNEENPKKVDKLIEYARSLPNSSYVSTAYPGGYVVNSITNEVTYMPGSILLATNIGILSYLWLAPSGLARGRISWLDNLKAILPQQAADDLYTDGGVIPILMLPGFGNPVIWGNKTFYLRGSDLKSKLQALNVRLLMLHLIRVWRKLLTNFIFDPNDPSVWDRILNVVKPPMDNMKSLGAFNAYRLTDETTDEDRDLGSLRIKVEVDPIRAIEKIYVTFIITRTGALSVAEASE